MRFLLAIFFALLAVLPHPALLAGVCGDAKACAAAEEEPGMEPGCACCQAGACGCEMRAPESAPRPASPAPVIQGADFYPVAATPPLEETNLSTLPAEQERQGVVVPTAGLRPAGGEVPLFVRHRAFLI